MKKHIQKRENLNEQEQIEEYYYYFYDYDWDGSWDYDEPYIYDICPHYLKFGDCKENDCIMSFVMDEPIRLEVKIADRLRLKLMGYWSVYNFSSPRTF